MNKIIDILESFGFEKSQFGYKYYYKNNKKAIVWNNGHTVTIIKNKNGTVLYEKTFHDLKELQKDLNNGKL